MKKHIRKLTVYDMNSGYSCSSAVGVLVSGNGISITIIVIMIASIASISASNLSVSICFTCFSYVWYDVPCYYCQQACYHHTDRVSCKGQYCSDGEECYVCYQ